MTFWLIISAVALPLGLSEFSEISPWAARHLLTWGARRLPGRERSERYREEWLAGIEEVPGKLIKLFKAVSIICYMVPVMNWRVNGPIYLWPTRRIADAIISRLAPALSNRIRARLMGSYTVYMGVPVRGRSGTFTVKQIRDLLINSRTSTKPGHMLPATEMIENGPLRGMLDHRQRRIAVFAGNYTEYVLLRVEGFSPRSDGAPGARIDLARPS